MPDRELTNLLRTGTDPLWVRLRQLLRERGIDPTTTSLVESFEDDEFYEYGVVETAEGKRFRYSIRYSETPLEHARFEEWERL